MQSNSNSSNGGGPPMVPNVADGQGQSADNTNINQAQADTPQEGTQATGDIVTPPAAAQTAEEGEGQTNQGDFTQAADNVAGMLAHMAFNEPNQGQGAAAQAQAELNQPPQVPGQTEGGGNQAPAVATSQPAEANSAEHPGSQDQGQSSSQQPSAHPVPGSNQGNVPAATRNDVAFYMLQNTNLENQNKILSRDMADLKKQIAKLQGHDQSHSSSRSKVPKWEGKKLKPKENPNAHFATVMALEQAHPGMSEQQKALLLLSSLDEKFIGQLMSIRSGTEQPSVEAIKNFIKLQYAPHDSVQDSGAGYWKGIFRNLKMVSSEKPSDFVSRVGIEWNNFLNTNEAKNKHLRAVVLDFAEDAIWYGMTDEITAKLKEIKNKWYRQQETMPIKDQVFSSLVITVATGDYDNMVSGKKGSTPSSSADSSPKKKRGNTATIPCKYGAKCNNTSCVFLHTDKGSSSKMEVDREPVAKKQRKECLHKGHTEETCWFLHPELRKKRD